MKLIAQSLNERAEEYFKGMIRSYPAKSNQASGLSWPIRHLVLKRVAHDLARPHGISTQRIFERGKEIEKWALNTLLPGMGVRIRSTGLPLSYPAFEIGGRMDAEVEWGRDVLPLEIKSMAYNSKYRAPADFLAGSIWTQNYYHQLNTYLLCASRERGLFLLIDPASYEPRFMEMTLDLGAAEDILGKLETVNDLVRRYAGRLFRPEEVEDLPECDDCSGYCQFQALCGRGIGQESDQADLDLDRIDVLAARRLELEDAAKEYEAVKDELRDAVRGHPSVITSRFMISGGEIETTQYKVPKEIKDRFAEKSRYWKVKKIIPLE